MNIPRVVSGRPVGKRGVHLQPFGFHGDWLKRAEYWTDLMVSMGISWVVLITDGDSVRQRYGGAKSPLEVLLDAGIIPIIRERKMLPLPFTEHDTVLWTIDLYGQYGLKPFWIIRNEPFDSREWVKEKVPSNAWDLFMRVWMTAAEFITDKGGYVGFPDGPCYDFNPFESIKAMDGQWLWDEGKAFYAGHHSGKGRPVDYPYCPYVQTGFERVIGSVGQVLTDADIAAYLDDFAEDRSWQEETAAQINRLRFDQRWLRPGLTALEDDTCWRGWELVAHRSLESFGYVVPMAMTEGGWVPRDRAGSGNDIDCRLPHTTPRMVARRTLEMFQAVEGDSIELLYSGETIPNPFFAVCPWLLADEDMGGSGWPFDAWHGWAFEERYGRLKPVGQALIASQPGETPQPGPDMDALKASLRSIAALAREIGEMHGA